MDPFVIKSGDTQPSLAATLSDDNGPIVIPGGASVTFVMRRVTSVTSGCGCGGSQLAATPAVNRAAVIVNAPSGAVRYDWVVGDTATPGEYAGEFKIVLGTQITTYPSSGYIPISINEDLL